LIEKTVTLDDISLIDFLGVENRNINELALAFPKSKIISRGNEIVVKGDSGEVIQIADVLG
jgi:phosphate starvation-inducible PhoH-like protein